MNEKKPPPGAPSKGSSTPEENHLAPFLLGQAMRNAGKKHNQPDLVRAGTQAVLKHKKQATKPTS